MTCQITFRKLKYLIIILLSGVSLSLKADSTDMEETSYHRIEGLMNVSNAISRFTGNGGSKTVFEEPFLMGIKITNKTRTSALRVGFNFSVSKVSEDLNGISKTSNINAWAPLLGYEWRKDLGYNFEFYGGVDARYYNDINRTETRAINSSGGTSLTIFNTSQKGWGFGPFCGFVYNITPRISLLTEGNLYLNYIRKVRNFSSDGSHYETFEDKYYTNLSPSAPSSVFLVIRF